MATRILFSLLALVVCFSLQASTLQEIVQRGTLRVGTEPNYFPFEMIAKNGDLIGFDIDIARHMAKSMGVELEIVTTTVDSAITGLVTQKYDVFMRGITLTQERNLKINFADPYFYSGQTMLIQPGLQKTIKNPQDLNDPKYTLVSKVGTTGEMAAKRLFKKANYVSFQTEQEAVLEVLRGRAHAFVFDRPFNLMVVKQHGHDKLYHLDTTFTFEPLAWGLRQGDVDFLNWLNNYLRQIKQDGTYDRLYEKWFKDDRWLKRIQ